MVKRSQWLSITPEPERELPSAVATLRAGGQPAPDGVRGEGRRIERLLLYRGQRAWIGYLHEVAGLIERRAPCAEPDVVSARERARAVLLNHHNLLLALPGAGARLTAADRALLTRCP